MLELIVTKLKDETRAPLVWITTTPIPSGACEPSMPPRSQVDVLAYNAAAAGVMAGDKRVTSCDVHETIMSQCGEGYEKCDLTYCEGPHFAEEGINLISERIQGCINEALTGSNSGGDSGGAAENSGSAGAEAESESDSESGNPENGGDEDVRKEKKSNCDHVYGQECADDAGDYASCLYCIHSNQDSFLVLGCVQHGMELVERFCGEPSAEEGEGEEGRSEEGGEEEGGEEEGGGGRRSINMTTTMITRRTRILYWLITVQGKLVQGTLCGRKQSSRLPRRQRMQRVWMRMERMMPRGQWESLQWISRWPRPRCLFLMVTRLLLQVSGFPMQ
jgi:hypothetical protein